MIFIKKNLSYKIRKDLSESDEHKEILSLEVSCKNSSNILLSCCYKPPKGDNDILSMFLKQVFRKSFCGKKPHYLIGYLNINCLEYFANKKVSAFYNSLFECGTNRPEYPKICYYNWCHHHKYFQWVFKKGIIKSDFSGHLPIFFSISTSKLLQNSSPLKLKKRFINESNLASFKDR